MQILSSNKRPDINQHKVVQTMLKYVQRIEERVDEKFDNMQGVPPEIEGIKTSIKMVHDALLMHGNSEGDASFLQTLRMNGYSSFEEWKEAGFASDLEANMLRINLDAFLESYRPSA